MSSSDKTARGAGPLALRDVEARYDDAAPAFRTRHLVLGEPGFTAIIGRNGSGKSTLMNLLARQLRSATGEVSLDGALIANLSPTAFARRVAHLPQRPPRADATTVRELAFMARYPWRGPFAQHNELDAAAVDNALTETGMSAYADRIVGDLSGGEQQRAWLAMLIAQTAPILLLDEPTAALDLAHALEALRLLRTFADKGGAVVAILHDVNLAARAADRFVALREGEVHFDGAPADAMTPELLTEIYGADVRTVIDPLGGPPVAIVA